MTFEKRDGETITCITLTPEEIKEAIAIYVGCNTDTVGMLLGAKTLFDITLLTKRERIS